jgi:hypothetical protein
MKNIAFLLFVVIAFATCKKPEVIYTLSGQIMPCFGYSINTDLQLYQKKASNRDAKVLATTKADANGNFTFTYSTDNTFDKLKLRQSTGFGFNNIIEEIDIKNIEGLKIYSPKYHLVVNLNVIKPYTSNDTLYMEGLTYTNPYAKFSGPFISGRKLVYTNRNVGTSINDPFYNGTNQVYICRLNSPINASQIFDKEFNVPLPSQCNGDSIYITLDIK